jgi:hypothetical protein
LSTSGWTFGVAGDHGSRLGTRRVPDQNRTLRAAMLRGLKLDTLAASSSTSPGRDEGRARRPGGGRILRSIEDGDMDRAPQNRACPILVSKRPIRASAAQNRACPILVSKRPIRASADRGRALPERFRGLRA